MSWQVGSSCFADLQSAAYATCRDFGAVSGLVNGEIRTATCESADVDGHLTLVVSTTNTATNQPTFTRLTQYMAFQPCQEADYVAAAEVYFGAILGMAALAYALWQVKRWVDRGARNQEP